MVRQERCEIMGGGFYEPILSLIPEKDRINQISTFADYLTKKFDYRPRGIWLTERVWEPGLISSLINSQVEYTVVDDTHFIYSGVSPDELNGYFLTEDEGQILKIFPGSMKLRYLVPFHPIDETVNYIKSLTPDQFYVFADDGEKFGLWPGTYDHVYQQGWLEGFLNRIEEEKIETLTFAEALQKFKPRGRVYLTCASYEEMGEWVLTPEVYSQLENLKQKSSPQEKRFLQGGYFKNFLVKYPEANIMHKRMLFISKHLKDNNEARRELWRAQASCAYWHGIFGGLYLPHLREAIYQHLIRADNLINTNQGFEILDFDCDGEDEIIFTDPFCFIVFKLSFGAIIEFDLRSRYINLINVLSRRSESYHRKLKDIKEHRPDNGEITSIHETIRSKEDELERFLVYDSFPRYAFIDFIENKIVNYNRYEIAGSHLKLQGDRLTKIFTLEKERIEIQYQASAPQPSIAIEINLGLFEENIEIDGKKWDKKRQKYYEGNELSIVNQDKKINILLSSPDLFRADYYPVETVSMSEGGFEKNYQGTGFHLHFASLPRLIMEVTCF